jgi:general secretion pathway protein H
MRNHGFTLIELLVVLVLVALGSSLVAMRVRDRPTQVLDQEADRLINLLENARAQARTSQTPMVWQSDANGFSLQPLVLLPDTNSNDATLAVSAGEKSSFTPWLNPGTRSEPRQLVISAEPVQAPMQLQLISSADAASRLTLGSDGVAPWKLLP